jgi:predicted alpha/beta superfamily hydrolase
LNFLKAELVPFIKANYRGDAARRILGGLSRGPIHSLRHVF